MSKNNHYIVEAFEKGYYVTDEGEAYSHKGHKLSLNCRPRGYPRISFNLSCGRVTVPAHRFAAYCFFGDELFKEGIQVRHLNSNPGDFRRENIALGTAKDNDADKTPEARARTNEAVSRTWKGRPAYNRKLSDTQLREIKRRLALGERGRVLAREFGVSDTNISDIKRGKTYSNYKTDWGD